MSDEVQTLVIDNGSGMMKAGFSGEIAPRTVFPSIIGRPKYVETDGGQNKDLYIGDEVLAKAGLLNLKHFIDHGRVNNWDEMEKVWKFIFDKKLCVDPSEHPVLLTDAIKNPKADREKMIQIMFETFNTPSFYIQNQGVLSLMATGRTTGMVLECGDGVTQFVPIYEGYMLTKAIERINFGGRNLTEWLIRLLNERLYNFDTSYDKEVAQDMKNKHCYVAYDFDQEIQHEKMTDDIEVSYKKYDGSCLKLSSERFHCPELLFNPLMFGLEFDGIHQILYDSIMKTNDEEQNLLFSNIVLSGGSTMFEGFPERIEIEITKIIKREYKSKKIKIIAAPERKYGAWIGGSIQGAIPIFKSLVITKDEYNDAGPGIVHRKCPQFY